MDDAEIERVQPDVKVVRRSRIDALDAAGIAVLLMLAWINLRWFDLNWDSVVYHLPFAALRTGLVRHSVFTLRPDLQERYDGFPPLADWVQGLLWRVIGMPEATQLVSPIAIGVFAAYARWVTGVRMLWTVVIFTAIPITLTALNSANLDVWTNAFFCIYLLSAFQLLRTPQDRWAIHGAIGLAALAVAVNSKLQFFVMAPWALLLQGAATLLLAWGDAELAVRRFRLRAVALMVVAAPLVMATPIRNTIAFGNPVYPFHVQIGGMTLPGAQSNVWVPPQRLAGLSQPALYLLSQLDFDAINMRFAGFSQDQGGQLEGADGNRMGGALSVLLIYSAGGTCASTAATMGPSRLRGRGGGGGAAGGCHGISWLERAEILLLRQYSDQLCRFGVGRGGARDQAIPICGNCAPGCSCCWWAVPRLLISRPGCGTLAGRTSKPYRRWSRLGTRTRILGRRCVCRTRFATSGRTAWHFCWFRRSPR